MQTHNKSVPGNFFKGGFGGSQGICALQMLFGFSQLLPSKTPFKKTAGTLHSLAAIIALRLNSTANLKVVAMYREFQNKI